MAVCKEKWQLNRAGLVNFWYYDEQEFEFANGRLLLRGANGSGKSVTMQSLLPLLLDGRKTPERLDPFGSQARRLEDYLLGEKDVLEREERTGYLFLEYRKGEPPQYLTTGIGLRARRQKPMKSWHFLLTDGRRVGRDFNLTRNQGEEKIPLTKKELQEELNSGGLLLESQKDYMEQVNKHLFGFPQLQGYEELIKLLLQLRSPKLSRDYRPTSVYRILNDSLPALSPDELRPLSDTIDNIDQIKMQLEQLYADRKALERLEKAYDGYNRALLYQNARQFLRVVEKEEKVEGEMKKLREEINFLQERIEKTKSEAERVGGEIEVLRGESRELQKHDVFELETRRERLQNEIGELRKSIHQKNEAREAKIKRQYQLQEQQKGIELRIGEINAEITDLEAILVEDARTAGFLAHDYQSPDFMRGEDLDETFISWKREVREHSQALQEIMGEMERKEQEEKKYRELDRELASARQELDRRREELREWEELYLQEKGNFTENVREWKEGNEILKFSPEEMEGVYRGVQNLDRELDFTPIRGVLESARRRILSEIEKKRARLNHSRIYTEEKLACLEEELEKLQREEPAPPRHPDTHRLRERLKRDGIPFLPFYRAFGFRAEVSQKEQMRLEAALGELGILDALLLPEGERKHIPENDRIFFPGKELSGPTLDDYLETEFTPHSPVFLARARALLKSIPCPLTGDVPLNSIYLTPAGEYGLPLMKGQAPGKEEGPFYIGETARYHYGKLLLRENKAAQEDLREELRGLKEDLLQAQREKEKLEQEAGEFPKEKDLQDAFWGSKERERTVKLHQEQVDLKNNKVREVLAAIENMERKIQEKAGEFHLPVTFSAYQEATQAIKEYGENLNDFQVLSNRHWELNRQQEALKEQLSELTADIEEYSGDLNVWRQEYHKKEYEKERITEKLQEKGVQEIRERIARVERDLKAREKQERELSTCLITDQNDQKYKRQELSKKENALHNTCVLVAAWKRVFAGELKLNLVYESPLVADKETAFKVLRDIKGEEKEGSRAQVLFNIFHEERSALQEFKPNLNLFSLAIPGLPEVSEDTQLELDYLKEARERYRIILDYGGHKLTPRAAREEIDKAIEIQKTVLSEKDRELYEEIIMNNIGRIIRTRISRAHKWVKEINQLMERRATSSGIKFSLAWKPRSAGGEGELDIKDLVDFLSSDPRLLKEEDMGAITHHFQKRIQRARELTEEDGGETLEQAIEQVLDYRSWYSFTLYYRREGEQRRELTDRDFNKFSGGEKALAMYIPLFSASYSRYQEARPDAPNIITLDEAFAGVDESNVRDMFELLESLDFDYLINSQSLWGDYDTVSSLAISELIRRPRDPFVTVIQYRWDGKSRTLVDKKGEVDRFERQTG